MLLYIIRHGEPDYATDTLTERGRKQAEAIGKRLYDSKINRIFSSPYGRAKETAEPACKMLDLEKNIEEWTHEIGAEGITTFPDGEKKWLWYLQNTYYKKIGDIDLSYDSSFECSAIKETEMVSAVKFIEQNGKIFLEKLGYREENGIYRILRNNEEKIALFCHGAFSAAWLSVLLHIPIHIFLSSFHVHTHTGVTIIEFKNNKNGLTAPQCLCFSDVSHLYASELDLLYDNRVEI